MKGRNSIDDVRTGSSGRPGISVSGDLKPGSSGIRLEGGVNLNQALAWNVGTCRSDAKGAGRAGNPRETLSLLRRASDPAAALFVEIRAVIDARP